MQESLDNLLDYCSKNQMIINGEKTKVMLFNTGRNYDFMPKLNLDGHNNLEVVDKFKLLGVHIRSDMKWFDNTDYITKKGYERLWIIRRLKKLGASESDLLDVYNKQVRCVLELAVPVWNPGLTKHEVKQLERVQKTAMYIILGEEYGNYSHALKTLNCETLEIRRENLCIKFAKKALKHEKYRKWFQISSEKTSTHNTRASKNKQPNLMPVPYRTDRYRDSPLPYLTNLLNSTN